jgi:hypothetical protein
MKWLLLIPTALFAVGFWVALGAVQELPRGLDILALEPAALAGGVAWMLAVWTGMLLESLRRS